MESVLIKSKVAILRRASCAKIVLSTLGGFLIVLGLLSMVRAMFSDQIGMTSEMGAGFLQADATLEMDTATITPNTINGLSYTITNTGTIDFQSNDGDQIISWLESEFTPVDYIQFTGTQFIDTGVPQTTYNIGITVDYQYTNVTLQGFTILFGARSSGSPLANAMVVVANHNNNEMIFQYSTTNPQIGTAAPNTTRHTLAITNNGRTASIINNGVVANTVTIAGSYAAPTVPYDIFLGAGNTAGNPEIGQEFIGEIFSFAITSDGTAILDLHPVIITATGECGFFDAISGEFFGNAGTGDLVCPTPTATNPMAILLYSSSVDDATIMSEITGLQDGTYVTAPSAVAGLDGSGTSATILGTAGAAIEVGQDRSPIFKIVLFVPNDISPVWANTTVFIGLASDIRGVIALNWQQEIRLQISTPAY